MVQESMFDVIIVGGGPGGMSAAMVLGRALRTVLLIDEGEPRHAVTKASHGYLTRDGIEPDTFRAIAQQELQQYPTIQRLGDTVRAVGWEKSYFSIVTASGARWWSRRVIIATGMKETLPSIKGLKDVYGISVFPCPYCDGFERKGKSLALFVSGEKLLSFTKLLYNWSRDVIVFTNGYSEVPVAAQKECEERGIRIVTSPVKALLSHRGVLTTVVTHNGEHIARNAGFIDHPPAYVPLYIPGITHNKRHGLEGDHHGETKVKGLYVIGDAKNAFTGLIGAAAEGYEAGVEINHSLVEEDWDRRN